MVTVDRQRAVGTATTGTATKRGQREFIPSRLENVVKELVRLKSGIILVLDRLQCVARVNCLVNTITDCHKIAEFAFTLSLPYITTTTYLEQN